MKTKKRGLTPSKLSKDLMISIIIALSVVSFCVAESVFDKIIDSKLFHTKGFIPICIIIIGITIFYLVLAPKKK